jgi:diaminopimelate decarboxylase
MIDITRGVTIGGCGAEELAKRYGTPLFVYDAEEVRTSWARIRGAFRYAPTHLHFAAVCNRNLHLLRLLRAEGAKLHANTPGDVYCGLRAGYEPRDIVFSGSNAGDEDLEYLLGARVRINLDSLDDLSRACEHASRGDFQRDFGLRMHLTEALPESRIGVREHELGAALAIAKNAGARVTALHVYCGTHGQSLQRYRESLDRLVTLALKTPDIECINLGGGFGYDYREPEEGAFPFAALARAADAAMRGLSERVGRTITLRVEPGRAVVAGAGVLLTRVRSVKREETRRYVGVDTTVANFTSPVVHGARRRVAAVQDRPAAGTLADVCGCTTYSRDFIARDAPLPDVLVGDLLAVLDVGAYGYCMSSHFLSRPRAAEVFVDQGVARLVTRRETFDDLVAAQVGLEEEARCAAE